MLLRMPGYWNGIFWNVCRSDGLFVWYTQKDVFHTQNGFVAIKRGNAHLSSSKKRKGPLENGPFTLLTQTNVFNLKTFNKFFIQMASH